jgi:hypothetical protein
MELDEAAARRLICAVCLRAVRDHRHGDEAAAQWIVSDMPGWLGAVGLDYIGPREVAAALTYAGDLNKRNLGGTD